MRFILHISLSGIEDPPVWRKIAVPVKLTFAALHKMIQAAMGWENRHLFSFRESFESRYFHVVSPYHEDSGINANRASASKILWDYLNQFNPDDRPRDRFCYE